MKIRDWKEPIEFARRSDVDDLLYKKLQRQQWEDLLSGVPEKIFNAVKKYERQLLCTMECFLQITDRQLVASNLARRENQQTIKLMIGAVFHSAFSLRTTSSQHFYATLILNLTKHTSYIGDCGLRSSTKGPTTEIAYWSDRFSEQDLNPENVRVWRGWITTPIQKHSRIYWPLYSVYQVFGADFTEALYRTLDEYHTGRAIGRLMPDRIFFKALIEEAGDSCAKRFLDPVFSTTFFHKLLIRFLEEGYRNGSGAKYSTLANAWRNTFVYFAENYLIASGLFAPPIGGIPKPIGGRVQGSQTNISRCQNGVEIKTKLLCDVPLQVSDSQAIEILFRQIGRDLALVRTWAENSIRNTWLKYLARVRNEKIGIPVPFPGEALEDRSQSKKWLCSPQNPERLVNAAATFARHGYRVQGDKNLSSIYGSPNKGVARALGMPCTGVLHPFCILLVLNHPIITQAFLEHLVMFDDHGRRIGLRETDGGLYLVGYKARSGPMRAEQAVLLTGFTKQLVEQILVLTEPLRGYLRSIGNPNWKFLLLTSGKGFGIPKKWTYRGDALGTNTLQRQKAEYLAAGISQADADRLIGRVTLTSVRATAAVEVYLKTHSAHEMAMALGHKEYSPRLLSHYLPSSIRDFFQERWIRIFQTGIIVQAMQGSHFLLEATGFLSMAEIHEFLNNNFLRIGDEINVEAIREDSQNEVIFHVNKNILSFLVALIEATSNSLRPVGAKAKYWSEIAKHLCRYISSDACLNHEIKQMLTAAQNSSASIEIGDLIYE
ncbi:hypothetical protein [Kordiimonas sp.]|uniref:hypothetical protein n=1 Tax=Kordiimonas sp. TaxID=1970157 RepID=UPI003A9433B3